MVFLLSILSKTSYLLMQYSHTMAGVLERIRKPSKQLVEGGGSVSRAEKKALQLQAAMEILAEVFGVGLSDVEDMLKQRYEEKVEWPREFGPIE